VDDAAVRIHRHPGREVIVLGVAVEPKAVVVIRIAADRVRERQRSLMNRVIVERREHARDASGGRASPLQNDIKVDFAALSPHFSTWMAKVRAREHRARPRYAYSRKRATSSFMTAEASATSRANARNVTAMSVAPTASNSGTVAIDRARSGRPS